MCFWWVERGTGLLSNPVILVMSHTLALQLLGTRQHCRPAEGWTASRLPHRPQPKQPARQNTATNYYHCTISLAIKREAARSPFRTAAASFSDLKCWGALAAVNPHRGNSIHERNAAHVAAAISTFTATPWRQYGNSTCHSLVGLAWSRCRLLI